MAETPAGAMLERIVHLYDEDGGLPHFYHLLRISIPEKIEIKYFNLTDRLDWKQDTELTQQLGNAWLASLETALARVPSAIMPHTWNYLLNPAHPDAQQITIQEVLRERFDNRLFGFGAR
jgi:RES domain-containing protein